MAKDNTVVLMGVGDIGPVHEPMDNYSTLARSVLATADIRFAQCERTYTAHAIGALEPTIEHRGNRPLDPSMISVFTDCGFDVVSLAGNHIWDWGADPVLDTIEHFRKKGIQAIGAGRNEEEARQPAIVEKNGVKVAILAYCSVLKKGHEAGPKKAGIAPLRAHTYYEPFEFQAGSKPRIITVPYIEDLEAMADDIAKAKKTAHIVVVSVHWGIHHTPRVMADYQSVAAKSAFRAGADLILGHHAHVPKAIETINDKVCFHSLGNFIFTTTLKTQAGYAERMKHHGVIPDDDEFPLCPHGKDSKHSLIAKAVLSREGVKKVSFLPVQIDKQLRPEVLHNGDPRFDTVAKYLDWASEGYDHKFTVEGDEVVVRK